MNLKFGESTVLFKGVIKNHRYVNHQACCVIFSTDKNLKITLENGEEHESSSFIIPSLLSHKLACATDSLFIFIEPNSDFSKTHFNFSNFTDTKLLRYLQHLQRKEFDAIDISEIDQWFGSSSLLDGRIQKSVEYIKSNLKGRISTNEISNHCFLSESRLQHLFHEQVGMPIRKYIHWQRIITATKCALRSGNLTESAFAGGFSDSAHFTRTFKKMFGVPPSSFFQR